MDSTINYPFDIGQLTEHEAALNRKRLCHFLKKKLIHSPISLIKRRYIFLTKLTLKKDITAYVHYVIQKGQIIVISITLVFSCLYGNHALEISNKTIDHLKSETVRIVNRLDLENYPPNSGLCNQRLHLSKGKTSGASNSIFANAYQSPAPMYRGYPGQKQKMAKLPKHIQQDNNNPNPRKCYVGDTKLNSKEEESIDMYEETRKITNQWYSEIRADQTDVEIIASNLGWKPSSVQKVKDHLFYNEHDLDRYASLGEPVERKRFDPDFKQAKAWRRLKRGHHTAKDIEWLKHEGREAAAEKRYELGYSASHEIAERKYKGNPWVDE